MQRSLTEGSIRVGLFRFALPILFANILQSLNASVNSIWVGRFLGEAALTATSNANTVMFLLIGAAFGIALAATILIGQSHRRQRHRRDQARGRHQRHVLRRHLGGDGGRGTAAVPAAADRHEHAAGLARRSPSPTCA